MNNKRKVVLITGATKRIGKSLALFFLDNGYDLAISHRADIGEIEKQEFKRKFDDQNISFFKADLDKTEDIDQLVDQLVEKMGRIDLLINNASIFEPVKEKVTKNDFFKFYNTNLIAPALLSYKLGAIMPNFSNDPSIINILDIFAIFVKPGFTPYTTSKAALYNLTRQLAYEMAPKVRVNGIAPGAILDPVTGADEIKKKRIIAKIPLGRFGEPVDIARTALFLADSSYITGQTIIVDGGRSIRV